MKKKIFALFLTGLLNFTSASAAEFSNEQEMYQNIDSIAHTLRIHYAPAPWKEQHIRWTLEGAVDKAKRSIASDPSPNAFKKTLKTFFQSLQDYHVGIIFDSTEIAMLPFQMEKVGNRFFVSRLFRMFSPDLDVPLEHGDEILGFDGVSMSNAFDAFLRHEGIPRPNPTDVAEAVRAFTMRAGAVLHLMPSNKETVTLDVRRKKDKSVEKIEVQWLYSPEKIPLKKAWTPWTLRREPSPESVLVKNDMTLPEGRLYRKLIDNAFAKSMERLGIKKLCDYSDIDEEKQKAIMDFAKEREGTLIPPLGEILWQSPPENYFQAFIYEIPTGEKVGFVRIHSFLPFDTLNIRWISNYIEKKAKAPWSEFADLMRFFQANTDALVIDQKDNNGGSFLYMAALARYLSDKPLEMPKHHLAIVSQDVRAAVCVTGLAEALSEESDEQAKVYFSTIFGPDYSEDGTVHGYPANALFKKQFNSFYAHLLSSWEKGETYASPQPLEGIDYLEPDPQYCYTKPLIVLIDESDFSCADFFPALIQDNKRGILFGTKTAGAGGAVQTTTYLNRMGVASYSFTSTLALRPNLAPIENLGVSPDIPYKVRLEDLTTDYRGYINTLNSAVHQLVK